MVEYSRWAVMVASHQESNDTATSANPDAIINDNIPLSNSHRYNSDRPRQKTTETTHWSMEKKR
jgi:hypothetical protein